MLNQLKGEDVNRAVRKALHESAGILVKETKEQLSKHIAIQGERKNRRGKALYTQRNYGVRVKEDLAHSWVKIHILGDFRLKFFEKGTKERHTKNRHILRGVYTWEKSGRKHSLREGKGRRTGSIAARWFFKTAQALTEHKIFSEMKERVAKAIERVAKKNGISVK